MPTSSDNIFGELVAKYSAAGNLEEAVFNANEQLMDTIRETGDEIPLVLMVSALDVWMEWVSRTMAATLMSLAADVHEWDPEEQAVQTRNMIHAIMLLKHDAFRAVYTGGLDE